MKITNKKVCLIDENSRNFDFIKRIYRYDLFLNDDFIKAFKRKKDLKAFLEEKHPCYYPCYNLSLITSNAWISKRTKASLEDVFNFTF